MAKIVRRITLLMSILCLGISVCAVAVANAKTVKLPWVNPKPIPNPPEQPLNQASIDPGTLKELVEFQEIVTEGVPLLLKLFNKLMKNKFAKPLIEVLLTCDKQNFMVSCMQGIFQKVMGVLTGQPNQAQPRNGDGVKKSHDYLQPHSKGTQAQAGKSNKGDDADKNVPRSDDKENDHDALLKSGENRMTHDSGIKIDHEEYHDHQSRLIDENTTQPAKAQHSHTPLEPNSADHKTEL